MVTPQVDTTDLKQWLVSNFSPEDLKRKQEEYLQVPWPEQFRNAETGKVYKPHHELERKLQRADGPRHLFVAGGEGGGKSVFGIIKTLERVRRGCSGILASPDLEHYKKSLWPEFKRWCPWERVIERHRYRAADGWEPSKAFTLVFYNDIGGTSSLICGGCKETQIKAWEGPNVNFAHLDEMRRHTTAQALKTFLGRVRIPGPGGIPPQLYITSTPLKHWLFEYFGPLECMCDKCQTEYEWDLAPGTKPRCSKCKSTQYTTEDIWHQFKLKSSIIRLRTEDNEPNLQENFASERALSLTEAEARVLLDAEWEDIEDNERFLPSMLLWDMCRSKDIPPLSRREPIVLGVDAAKGRTNDYSDCFAIVGVSRHWEKERRRDSVVVRFVHTWQAKPGKKIDWIGTKNAPGPETLMRKLCKQFNIIQIAYDPNELHDLGTRFTRERIVWMKEFGQTSRRIESDTDLLHIIISARLVHDGDLTLRSHIGNADRKVMDDGRKLRLVKRLENLKIDAAVALSMAVNRCLYGINIA